MTAPAPAASLMAELARAGIRDQRVLIAMEAVPRDLCRVVRAILTAAG